MLDQLTALVASKTSNPDSSDQTENTSSVVTSNYCCQIVLLGLQIELCKNIHEAITKRVSTGDEESVTTVLNKVTTMISTLAKTLRENEVDNNDKEIELPVEERPMRPEGASRGTSASLDRIGSAALGSEAGRSEASVTSGKGNHNEKPPEPQPDVKQSTFAMLTPSDIQRICNILTYLTHTRDLIEELDDKPDVTAVDNWFNWFINARHCWDDEKQTCRVDMVNHSFDYGFEYQGTTSRLVLSPTTDRCLMGLAYALKSKLIGLCTGPPVSIL